MGTLAATAAVIGAVGSAISTGKTIYDATAGRPDRDVDVTEPPDYLIDGRSTYDEGLKRYMQRVEGVAAGYADENRQHLERGYRRARESANTGRITSWSNDPSRYHEKGLPQK